MLEKIFFKSSAGTGICGILSGPVPTGKVPAAVLCHGFATGKDSRTYVRLEKILNDAGVAALRFDFFGHGESGGDLADITVSEAADEAVRALAFMRSRGYVPLGLMGSSFGGLAAVLAAAGTPDLACLALKSPVSDYLARLIADRDGQSLESWRSRGSIALTDDEGSALRLNYSFYEDAEAARGYDVAPRISAPALIVHGAADETVPVNQSRRMASVLPRGRLVIVPGADHRYSREKDFEIMLERISGFLIRHLTGI
jgi:dipeptidyl aminopeptidase/acylaminoacyl peptidase